MVRCPFVNFTQDYGTCTILLTMRTYLTARCHRGKMAVIFCVVMMLGFGTAWGAAFQAEQPQTSNRKVKVSTPPDYPELARKMNLHGVARVLLTVAPDGKVVDVKEVGGNPVLVSALAKAAKKWRYEPAERQSLVEASFEFK